MRGELLPVWCEMWGQVWLRLERLATSHPDLFCELYRELSGILLSSKSVEELADVLDDPRQARSAFRKVRSADIAGEAGLVVFLESCYDVLDDLGGTNLSNEYFNLLEMFLVKFSIRYDLRRPLRLCPTLSGVFTRLVSDLRDLSAADSHLNGLMRDFEAAVRDLRTDTSDTRIKTCIQKQMNLLEAMGAQYPGVTTNNLSAICGQVTSWPHSKLQDAVRNLYTFSCDYPGIRHGGTQSSAIRAIDMRDLVAVTIALMGFAAYLNQNLDPNRIYGG